MRSEETVEIPELQSEKDGQFRTVFEVSMDKSERASRLTVEAEGMQYSSAGRMELKKDGVVKYSVSMDKRKTLDGQVELFSYGSVKVEPALLRESLGDTEVSFRRAGGRRDTRNVSICFVRTGELVCPPMTESTVMPSGSWQVMGFEFDGEERFRLAGDFTQRLFVGKSYVLELVLKKAGEFGLLEKSSSDMVVK